MSDTIQASNRGLSFEGPAETAYELVDEIRTAFSEAGCDTGKLLGDFLFAMEVALQEVGFIDEDFNKVECVNACAGIPDPETTVPELITAIKMLIPCAESAEICLRAEGLNTAADKCLSALENSRPLLAKLEGGAK